MSVLYYLGVDSAKTAILESILKGVDPDSAAALQGLDLHVLQAQDNEFAIAVMKADAQCAAQVAEVLYEGAVLKRSVAAARYLLEARLKRKAPLRTEIYVSAPASTSLEVRVPSNGRGPVTNS